MANKYVGAAKFGYEKVIKPAVTAIKKTFSKKSPTITKTKPKVGSLTIRRKDQDDVIKNTQKVIDKKNLTPEGKIAVKKTIAPAMRDISKTRDQIVALEKKLSDKGKEKLKKIRDKKMGGGMMGRRFGYKTGLLVGKQKKIDVAAPFNKITSEDFIKLRKGKKAITQRTRGKTQPPKEPMRDRMKQPLKSLPTPKDKKRPGGKS